MRTVLIGIPCLQTGGTEIQTLRLVEALVQGGYRVVTVCYYENRAEMVKAYTDAGSDVVCLSEKGERPKGIKAEYRFLHNGLKKVVRQYRPNIAHVQYMAPGALPLIILKRLGVKTLIATSHTTADVYSSLKLVRLVERHITKVFTCVTCSAEESFFGNSNLYSDNIRLKRHNHVTIYNCIPPSAEFGWNENRNSLTIGVVSRLVAIKGMDLVMPAFAELKSKIPNAKLIIVGDGELRETMETQQRELGLEESVEWTGLVEKEQLGAFYDKMDLVWVPSRSEGFGLTALEAMAHGCVVVAANVGGLKEVVEDEKNGILFESGNKSDLAQKSVDLLQNKDIFAKLSKAAVERAKLFSFEEYKKAILGLYAKL